jgi:hypothetical protein
MPLSPTAIARTLERLKEIHIETERDRDFRSQLERLLRVDDDGNLLPEPVLYSAGLEARGIAFIEGAGGGKSTAIRRTLMNTPALAPDPETGFPRYLEIQVPSPATLKSLGFQILETLKFEAIPSQSNAWEIWSIVRHQLKLKGVVVLWLDEAHDLFLSRSAPEIDDVLKMIKSMTQKDSQVIVVLSGTERLFEITNFDAQVNRRLTKVIPRELDQGVDNDVIAKVVTKYCGEADLQPDLRDNLAGRLIHGSRGRFGRAIETTLMAIERALRDGDDTLTIAHFAEAWGMQEGCDWEANVFAAPDWAAIALDRGAAVLDAARTARLRKILSRI